MNIAPILEIGPRFEFTIAGTRHAQSICDVRSYEIEYRKTTGEVDGADRLCRANGHAHVWSNGLGIVISNPPQKLVSRQHIESGTVARYTTTDGKVAIIKIERPGPMDGDNARITVLTDWSV